MSGTIAAATVIVAINGGNFSRDIRSMCPCRSRREHNPEVVSVLRRRGAAV